MAKPKAREIHAAAFRDRVVHHWLVPRLEALYEPVFIHDIYSNRRNKGTHKAVQRLQSFMHRLSTENKGKGGYFLQLDIASFFVCIDRPLLFQLLQKRLKKAVSQGKTEVGEAKKMLWLCHIILKQDVGREAWPLSSPQERACVPAHKRLANTAVDKGLPIGNLTSQFFANVYMNELDQFIKHRLKCRSYLRYVDDMVLLHADPGQLRRWHEEIAAFLLQRLQLTLRPDTVLRPVSQGVDFLGYIVRPHYMLVRRRVVGNLHEKLATFERRHVCRRTEPEGTRFLRLELENLYRLRQLLASYLGHFRHANSQRLIRSLWRRRPWLGLFFAPPETGGGGLRPLWQPHSVSGYNSQVRFFRKRFPYSRVVVQRGCENDAFTPWVQNHALPDALPALYQGIRQLNVVEAGYLKGGLKRRVIHSFVLKPGATLCLT